MAFFVLNKVKKKRIRLITNILTPIFVTNLTTKLVNNVETIYFFYYNCRHSDAFSVC
jgi:hypothetical protein